MRVMLKASLRWKEEAMQKEPWTVTDVKVSDVGRSVKLQIEESGVHLRKCNRICLKDSFCFTDYPASSCFIQGTVFSLQKVKGLIQSHRVTFGIRQSKTIYCKTICVFIRWHSMAYLPKLQIWARRDCKIANWVEGMLVLDPTRTETCIVPYEPHGHQTNLQPQTEYYVLHHNVVH